jgi:hypothetical protein
MAEIVVPGYLFDRDPSDESMAVLMSDGHYETAARAQAQQQPSSEPGQVSLVQQTRLDQNTL